MLLTRQQLEQRLVALQQASLELVKDTSLETLLERIAKVALEQVNARYAALGVQDQQGKLKQFITVGMTSDEIKRMEHPPLGLGLIDAMMKTNAPMRMADLRAHPESAGFPKNHPEMRSFLGVPIRLGKQHFGQIYLTEKKDLSQFTQDDENIIQMLASYAAVAIQNARLYEDLKERERAVTLRNADLTLLNELSAVLIASLDESDILNKTLALVMNYLNVEAGEIFLLENNQTLRLVLHRGEAAEAFWSKSKLLVGEGLIGLSAQKNEPVITRNLATDKRIARPALIKAGFKQFSAFPLTASGKVVGVLSASTRSPRVLDEHDMQLVQAVCATAGLSIENADLNNNVRRLAILEERDRIGMDLHDGIIQSIYGVGLVLENAKLLTIEDPRQAQARIEQTVKDLNQIIRDLRSYILDLRPRQLGEENIIFGLKRLVTEYRANTLKEAILNGSVDDMQDMPQKQALALFHICQEALANVAKHANAKRVNVDLWKSDQRYLLEIRDNGKGFNFIQTAPTLGHGLANIQTRAHNAGGDVEINSAAGEGTSILAWVPRVEQS